jgi:putative nucleotidyltransferase with HDIG domain
MQQPRSLQFTVIGGFSAVLLLVVIAEILPGGGALAAERSLLFYGILASTAVILLALLSLVLSGRVPNLSRFAVPLVVLYTSLIGLLVQQTGGVNSSFHLLFAVPILTAAVYHRVRGATYAAILVGAVWSSVLLLSRPDAVDFSVIRTHLLVGNPMWLLVALVAGLLAGVEHETQLRNEELLQAERELVEAGINLSSILDLGELLNLIVELAASVVKAEAASLLLRDAKTGELVFEVALGAKSEDLVGVRIQPGQGVVGWVAEHLEPLLIADAQSDERFFAGMDRQTGFETRSLMCVPLKRGDRIIGALEMLNKQAGKLFTESDLELCAAFGSQAAVAIENARLIADKDEMFVASVDNLATALEFRDTETEGHSRRVREYTLAIAREMGVPREELETIGIGALLHDIGKIGVPDAILRKPGRLTDAEYEEMKTHAVTGFTILERNEFLAAAADLPLHHHERWDGTGYPHRLKGEDLAVGPRAFAVADTLDAITSDRPYRKAQSLAAAREEIQRFSGSQFDPRAVAALERLSEEVLVEMRRQAAVRRSPQHGV